MMCRERQTDEILFVDKLSNDLHGERGDKVALPA